MQLSFVNLNVVSLRSIMTKHLSNPSFHSLIPAYEQSLGCCPHAHVMIIFIFCCNGLCFLLGANMTHTLERCTSKYHYQVLKGSSFHGWANQGISGCHSPMVGPSIFFHFLPFGSATSPQQVC